MTLKRFLPRIDGLFLISNDPLSAWRRCSCCDGRVSGGDGVGERSTRVMGRVVYCRSHSIMDSRSYQTTKKRLY